MTPDYNCPHGYRPEAQDDLRDWDRLIGFVLGCTFCLVITLAFVWGMHG